MTPQQIAEKVKDILTTELNVDYNHRGQVYVDGINEATAELSTLITTLQKETWNQACKAQTVLMKQPDPTFIGGRCVICDPVWASQTKIGPGIPADYKCQCGNVVRYIDNMDGKSYHVCHSALGDYPLAKFNHE